jgi:hypothetical protein
MSTNGPVAYRQVKMFPGGSHPGIREEFPPLSGFDEESRIWPDMAMKI